MRRDPSVETKRTPDAEAAAVTVAAAGACACAAPDSCAAATPHRMKREMKAEKATRVMDMVFTLFAVLTGFFFCFFRAFKGPHTLTRKPGTLGLTLCSTCSMLALRRRRLRSGKPAFATRLLLKSERMAKGADGTVLGP